MELQHFRHRQPLIYHGETKGIIKILDLLKITCLECLEPISGAFYHCQTCNFILHKSCAELPLELQHPSHPKHTLLLHAHETRIKCEDARVIFITSVTTTLTATSILTQSALLYLSSKNLKVTTIY